MKSIRQSLLERYGNSDKDIVLDGADLISQKGFTLIPNYVLHTNKISAYAKLVYAVLLSYAWGKKNSSFPGQQALIEDSGLSESTVRRAIRELEAASFITVIQRGQGKTNLYILHFVNRNTR
jgi:DNA-binding MarR family transcriptional regulator